MTIREAIRNMSTASTISELNDIMQQATQAGFGNDPILRSVYDTNKQRIEAASTTEQPAFDTGPAGTRENPALLSRQYLSQIDNVRTQEDIEKLLVERANVTDWIFAHVNDPTDNGIVSDIFYNRIIGGGLATSKENNATKITLAQLAQAGMLVLGGARVGGHFGLIAGVTLALANAFAGAQIQPTKETAGDILRGLNSKYPRGVQAAAEYLAKINVKLNTIQQELKDQQPEIERAANNPNELKGKAVVVKQAMSNVWNELVDLAVKEDQAPLSQAEAARFEDLVNRLKAWGESAKYVWAAAKANGEINPDTLKWTIRGGLE